jgi:hypothetical protein
VSVLGAISQKDKGTGAVLPNLQAPPESTGFFQNIRAGFTQSVAGPHSTQNARAIYEHRQYDQIVQALNAEGEQATDYVDSPVRVDSPFYHHVEGEQVLPDGRVRVPVPRAYTNPYSEGPSLTRDVNPLTNLYLGGDQAEVKRIWEGVAKVRARKPGFLKEFADSNAVSAVAMEHRKADQATAGDVTSRATTLGSIGGFIGNVAGSITSLDPENFVGGWSGAAGKSVARTVVKRATEGAVANTLASVAAVPGQATDAASMGQTMTPADIAHSVGVSAVAGAVLGTAHTVIPHVPGAVATVAGKAFDTVAPHLPDSVRDPVVAASIRAGTVKDRELLHEFQKLHSPYSQVDTSTPTEKAAAHVMVHEIETKEQSPLHPAQEGANANRLSAVAQSLGVDLTPPEMPTTAPVQTPTVRDRTDAPVSRRPASYADAVHSAEGTGKNPNSSAEGHFQFTEGTWLQYAPRVTNTEGMSRGQILGLRHDLGIATAAEQAFRADNGRFLRARGLEDSPGNLSLAHFFGPADAAKTLKADPHTPIENIIDPRSFAANRKLLTGKSADEVIAWANKRIGASVDHAPARADAVPDEGYDYSSPVRYAVEELKPEELPPTSAQAPTDQPWDPVSSQHLLVWEAADGTRSLMDGGKRLAHARSLYPEDQSIRLPTVVLREADGVSEEMAMLVGKLKNVNLGTTSLEEAAGTLADIPEIAAALRSPQFKREIAAIAQLPYEKFGEVMNSADPLEAARGMGDYQGSLTKTASWVIRNKKTGEVVMETFEPKHVAALNTKKYEAVPIQDYLGSLNGEAGNETATLTRRAATSRRASEPPSREGRALAPQEADALVSRGSQPSLVDTALAARDAAEKFSEPAGPEAQAHAALIEHDLRAEAGLPKETPREGETVKPEDQRSMGNPIHLFDLPETGFRLSEEGEKPITLKQAIETAEADTNAAQALKDCL